MCGGLNVGWCCIRSFVMVMCLPDMSRGVFWKMQLIHYRREWRRCILGRTRRACYSYNYKEGKYTLNYSLFVGAGSFILGGGLIAMPIIYYRKRKETRS